MNKDIFKENPILQTKRLILREIRESDEDSIFEIYSDQKVAEYDNFEPIDKKEYAIKCIRRYIDNFHEHEEIRWGLARKEDDVLVGTCGLSDFDEEVGMCEIGYDLMRSQWNRGYMTEAIEKIVEFAFEKINVNRIQADTDPKNIASMCVLEKNNFKREGHLRHNVFFKGQLWDSVIFGILRSDYEKGKEK